MAFRGFRMQDIVYKEEKQKIDFSGHLFHDYYPN